MQIIKVVIIIFFIAFCFCNSSARKILLLPEGSDNTGLSNVCSGGYSGLGDKCYNELDEMIHELQENDIVFFMGHEYTIDSSSSTFDDEYIKLNISVSLFSGNSDKLTKLHFTQNENGTLSYIITLDSDNIHIEGLLINATQSDNLVYVVRI